MKQWLHILLFSSFLFGQGAIVLHTIEHAEHVDVESNNEPTNHCDLCKIVVNHGLDFVPSSEVDFVPIVSHGTAEITDSPTTFCFGTHSVHHSLRGPPSFA